MNALFKTAGLVAAGAAVMYFLDPQAGRRRRALARDRSAGAVRELEHSARIKSRDASNRMHGKLAETRSHLENAPVDDETLHDRIRAKLGHLMDRPAAACCASAPWETASPMPSVAPMRKYPASPGRASSTATTSAGAR